MKKININETMLHLFIIFAQFLILKTNTNDKELFIYRSGIYNFPNVYRV